MSKRMIFLMGAPTSQNLRWDEDELLSTPIFPFHAFDVQDQSYPLASETLPVKWRLLKGPRTPEALCETANMGLKSAAQFFTTHDLAVPTRIPMEVENSELSQFYDHSFAVHETSEISALALLSSDSMLDSGRWTESTETSSTSYNERDRLDGSVFPVRGEITDLQDIPSATHLHSIVPQTMTVNVVVAVIEIRPSRRIVTRQWKKELDLVEVVVADETKSGFGVTFWLPPAEQNAPTYTSDKGGDELRKSLALLRPRDIVLLRMVGLNCFRERVYGQSLRGGLTKIDLLYRQQVDITDTGGIFRLRDIIDQHHAAKNDDLPLVKVRKVSEWIRQFVDSVPDKAGGGRRQTVTLPPDTQENRL